MSLLSPLSPSFLLFQPGEGFRLLNSFSCMGSRRVGKGQNIRRKQTDQYIFLEWLLCTKHCSRPWGCSYEQADSFFSQGELGWADSDGHNGYPLWSLTMCLCHLIYSFQQHNDMCYYYPHFIGEEIEAERFSNLHQLVDNRGRILSQAV